MASDCSILSRSARYCLRDPTDAWHDRRLVVHFRYKFGPWWQPVSDRCQMFPLEYTGERGIVGVHLAIVAVDVDRCAIGAYLRHPRCELDPGIDQKMADIEGKLKVWSVDRFHDAY